MLAMRFSLSDAIYSLIALSLSFALNRIFFSANENGTVKQNNQSDFQSHCKTMKDNNAGTDQNLVILVFRLLNCAISKWI